MKKLFSVLMLLVFVFSLASCGSSNNKLYLLNWDEYIDEGLLEKFEEQYNCKVIMEIAESNEIMYSRIKTNSADYDIAIPSDYMVSQMAKEGMINKLDYEQLENYDFNNLVETLQNLINTDCEAIKDYIVPYFWGSLGIMYNTDILSEEDLEAKIEALGDKNEWNLLFDKELEQEIGMYATARDSIACALMALGYSVNTKDKEQLKEAEEMLKKMNYKAWATDDLKVGVAGGKYTMALCYSGDFIDALYSLGDDEEAHFDMYVPKDKNNVFFDAMVIPVTSKNTDLAYKFIDFMINTEPDDPEDEECVSNAFANADAIGYCPTIQSIYDEMLEALEESPEDYEGVVDSDAYYPGDIPGGEVYQYLGSETYDLYENIYKRVKSNTNEEDVNVSGYILLGIVVLLVGGFTAYFIIDKNKKKKTN